MEPSPQENDTFHYPRLTLGQFQRCGSHSSFGEPDPSPTLKLFPQRTQTPDKNQEIQGNSTFNVYFFVIQIETCAPNLASKFYLDCFKKNPTEHSLILTVKKLRGKGTEGSGALSQQVTFSCWSICHFSQSSQATTSPYNHSLISKGADESRIFFFIFCKNQF